ncbi:YpdA family putative bacillithiol disulfide reductase [Chitinophaga sp. Mgbs1]|uniref:YpdA family putative bacillithiol disulfide reductase n=1 Tax=Chitinophaga solisilvae TaxID=1233460 RepID=A0A433WDS0_9BACT|nr:YpdA family putative bacillithiol disulfide reductase [Chitinophaga solisilvae]
MAAAFDVLIIGGGPIGIACGLAAKKAGLQYTIVEKGCLVNSLYNYPLYMTFFSTSERLEVGGIPFVSINPKPGRPEALEYYRRVATSEDLRLQLFEEVLEITPNAGQYIVQTSRNTYHTRNVIIATGFYDIPNLLDVPGEHLPKVTHYYKDPHYYATRKVIVIGAHNSAVDAALETYRRGAQVTMVIRDKEIGNRVKYWVKPDIENRIREGSITAHFNSTVTAIREKEADIATPEGNITIANDFVIAMTGYQPNFRLLEKAGILLSDDGKKIPAYHPLTMETNMPHIYLAGVVCGGMNTHLWFIENSREHADRIIGDIMQNR